MRPKRSFVNQDFLDHRLALLPQLFGSGNQPTHIYMNRDSLELLRSSRTATNQTGAPAPRPTSVEGIPVLQTDGILNGEAVVN